MKFKSFIAAMASAVLLFSCNAPENQNTQKSSEVSFNEVIKTRRSVRAYDSTKTISEQEVRQLLTAVQEAPSWANQQPTKYYVAMSKDKVDAVRDLIGGNKERTMGANVFIVSTFERGKSGFFNGEAFNEIGDGWGAYDNGLSNAYLVLVARAMGFDTLIMGMRDSDALRELFGIPGNETVMAVLSLGYRDGEPKTPQHRNFDEVVKIF
ncbi:MAG: nitroreductase family protein [Bacteroidales bacterium]|nr:nitroreductase family protein [Bacteroidales bacterium]